MNNETPTVDTTYQAASCSIWSIELTNTRSLVKSWIKLPKPTKSEDKPGAHLNTDRYSPNRAG